MLIIVVKYAKRPPSYDETLNDLSYKILPLAICCHMFVAIFVYTTIQIYPFSVDNGSGILDDKGITKRILSKFGLIFFIGIALILCLIILKPIIERIIHSLWKKSKYTENRDIRFTAIKDRISKNSITTYDIRKNPRYSLILKEVKRDIT